MQPIYKDRPSGFDIRPASPGTPTRITETIHLSEGLSNSFLISTDEGRIVVNTGMGFEGPIHRANYDSVDSSPTRYIILTQGHVDHVGGVDCFLEAGTDVVAQANNQTHQADDARIQAFRARRSYFAFASAMDHAAEALERVGNTASVVQSTPVPTLTFADRHEIDHGGCRLELLSVPGGETTDSLAIWLPDDRICFSGNLFSALFGHFPNLVTIRGDRYREAPRFVESLERVRALDPEMLLVGHHAPVVGSELIQRELIRLRKAVEWVHRATVRGMNDGTDVFTLMRDLVLPRDLEVGEGYGKIAWSVRAIWETYAGWFHQHSTTELYGDPPWSVSADLVDLAGADAIAERAARKVADDEPLAAIRLAEHVLRVDPDHTAAIDAGIAAHEALVAESVNFWETQWLRHQIELLRANRK